MGPEDRNRFSTIVDECARTHNITADVAHRVVQAIRPSVRLLTSSDLADELGSCRVGGLPDLPVGTPWPTFANPDYDYREYPYRFLMQIDLAVISPFDIRGLLPTSGHLYFFCHWQDENNNSDWAGERSKVLFSPHAVPLRRADIPLEAEDFRIYRSKRISPALQWMVPAPCEAGFEAWAAETPYAFFREVGERIEEVEVFADRGLPNHRVLGYADLIQSPGLGEGTELLAQVDSYGVGTRPREDDGMLWGDSGTVYFLIDYEALRNREFGKAWSFIEMC